MKQRLFIGFRLSSEIQDYLVAIQNQLGRKSPVCWVRRENLHLTLRFLGETEAGLIRPISTSLSQLAANYAPVTLTLTELGYFPNADRPNVVWAGMKGDIRPMQQLRAEIDLMLDSHGFKRDRYGFNPHLTLGYIKKGIVLW